ncbi:MAG TPA: hypothetical protein VE397_09235 [Stellaceae bacterium]|nr:hypothetical protein [Stellaceae bacterium]
MVFSLVAAAALLASLGAATANDPVKLTAVRRDNATAGAAANETATDHRRPLVFPNIALGFLTDVPQQPPGLTASDGTLDCIAACAA